MKRIQAATASAIVMLLCLPAVQAAPRQRDLSPASNAQATLGDIDLLSDGIAGQAFELREMATSTGDPDSQLEGLSAIKDDVNRIGRELQSLEADRESLSPWEAKALDETTPLVKDIADNTGQAIQTFDADRLRVPFPSYTDKTRKIEMDAREVATQLHDYMKLADSREKEQHLEQSLSDAGQF
jgi:hypothetical protein